mmetsp:Transcript_100796/g.240268  ORF Transcript_100796/g.240268 Transcript_100796/m.240268 type:complete len:270 (-) Transcript_100796:891-1700(-)
MFSIALPKLRFSSQYGICDAIVLRPGFMLKARAGDSSFEVWLQADFSDRWSLGEAHLFSTFICKLCRRIFCSGDTSGSRLFSFSSGARNSLCGQGVRSGVTSGETGGVYAMFGFEDRGFEGVGTLSFEGELTSSQALRRDGNGLVATLPSIGSSVCSRSQGCESASSTEIRSVGSLVNILCTRSHANGLMWFGRNLSEGGHTASISHSSHCWRSNVDFTGSRSESLVTPGSRLVWSSVLPVIIWKRVIPALHTSACTVCGTFDSTSGAM